MLLNNANYCYWTMQISYDASKIIMLTYVDVSTVLGCLNQELVFLCTPDVSQSILLIVIV